MKTKNRGHLFVDIFVMDQKIEKVDIFAFGHIKSGHSVC